MSDRDLALTLRQIVEFAEEIETLIATRARKDLDINREFRRALERCVELIGEAATRLPESWRGFHSEIPWAADNRDAQRHDPRIRSCGGRCLMGCRGE